MKRLFSIDEAAEYLGRTPDAIQTLVYRGKLPIVRIDRRRQFDVRDLDKLIDDRKEIAAEGSA